MEKHARSAIWQIVNLHTISFLIFYGSLIGCIILLPLEEVLSLVTKILFPAEVVLCSYSEVESVFILVSLSLSLSLSLSNRLFGVSMKGKYHYAEEGSAARSTIPEPTSINVLV